MSKRIAILGRGAWGRALGASLEGAGAEVSFWTRGGAAPPPADAVIAAVPAQTTREVLAALAAEIAPGTALVLAAKGLERGTLARQSEIAAEVAGHLPAAVLTGPSLAAELVRGLPTAVTLAAPPETGERLQAMLATPSLRPYLSDDIAGAEAGGALKNVIAIACGAAIGAGYGESARAGLMARGFAEMVRIGTAMGGRAETLAGLSGLGDLALTGASPKSRNYVFGLALGAGRSPDAIAADGRTYEGTATAPVAVELAARLGVEAPVTAVTARLVAGEITPKAAFETLFNRPLRRES